MEYRFSQTISFFHDIMLPEREVQLAGYSAIIAHYELSVPVPHALAAISQKHKRYKQDCWEMFSPRHMPPPTLFGHLTFALKYEGVDLLVLKALFSVIEGKEIAEITRQEPTSSYGRRIWFLYEWLTDKRLDVPDASKINFVDLINSKLQYPGQVRLSQRHRVRNNLPGVRDFCPIIRRTEKLERFIKKDFTKQAQKVIGAVQPDILSRACAFLLLKDSKASYAIEGETPVHTRAERWGRAIGQAGQHNLSHDEFLRLQRIVIADFRYTPSGYRYEDGFIGERMSNLDPIPVHISSRPADIKTLMEGLLATNEQLKNSDFDPVLAASIIAFGFVFIHPFFDGNGRIHRYLIHHVLAKMKFTPTNIVFPVSSVILNHIDKYRQTLEAYSQPRLEFVKWRPTLSHNVEVQNDTIDLYRYFDATPQAEFLYSCIEETITKTLPEEVRYLISYDKMKHFVNNYLEMPDKMISLLILFLVQNDGKLSKRARSKEFFMLNDDEIATLEARFSEIFYNDEEND